MHADARHVVSPDTGQMEHRAEQPVAHTQAPAGSHAQGQQHPLGIYFKIWGLLFVLSIGSYLVDYFHVQGLLRWFLIVTFMLLKAGLIVSVFMHMLWERLALVYAIVVPPLLLLVLLAIGALEADYTFLTRGAFFGATPTPPPAAVQHK
jgi:cytochrome c oxidase subunit IV